MSILWSRGVGRQTESSAQEHPQRCRSLPKPQRRPPLGYLRGMLFVGLLLVGGACSDESDTNRSEPDTNEQVEKEEDGAVDSNIVLVSSDVLGGSWRATDPGPIVGDQAALEEAYGEGAELDFEFNPLTLTGVSDKCEAQGESTVPVETLGIVAFREEYNAPIGSALGATTTIEAPPETGVIEVSVFRFGSGDDAAAVVQSEDLVAGAVNAQCVGTMLAPTLEGSKVTWAPTEINGATLIGVLDDAPCDLGDECITVARPATGCRFDASGTTTCPIRVAVIARKGNEVVEVEYRAESTSEIRTPLNIVEVASKQLNMLE